MLLLIDENNMVQICLAEIQFAYNAMVKSKINVHTLFLFQFVQVHLQSLIVVIIAGKRERELHYKYTVVVLKKA